jgi:hypothetical protein
MFYLVESLLFVQHLMVCYKIQAALDYPEHIHWFVHNLSFPPLLITISCKDSVCVLVNALVKVARFALIL